MNLFEETPIKDVSFLEEAKDLGEILVPPVSLDGLSKVAEIRFGQRFKGFSRKKIKVIFSLGQTYPTKKFEIHSYHMGMSKKLEANTEIAFERGNEVKRLMISGGANKENITVKACPYFEIKEEDFFKIEKRKRIEIYFSSR